jgi:hypothetical protein
MTDTRLSFLSLLGAPLLLATTAWCVPKIDSVVTQPDGRLVITGSGFGEHPDFSPGDATRLNLAWTSFDSGRLTSESFKITEGLTQNWRVTAEGSRPHSGFHAQKYFNNSRLGALAYMQTQNPGQWYTSFWFRLLPNTQGGKFFRMYASGQQYNVYLMTGGTDTMIRGFSEVPGLTPAPVTQWSSPQHLGNEWRRIEIWMSEKTNEVTVWIDGLHQWTKTNWMPSSFPTANHTWDFGNMINEPAASDGQNGAYSFDDIYLSYTRARVELTESPRLEFSREREIQTPIEWSDTRIVVRQNKGAFDAEETVYIHVIDADGRNGAEGRVLAVDQPNTNVKPPRVQTGSAQEVPFGGTAQLTATVFQDEAAAQSGSLVTVWSQVSGPSYAQVADNNALNTPVRMGLAGDYVFRFFAFDGSQLVYSDQNVTVLPSKAAPGKTPVVLLGSVVRPDLQQAAKFSYELTQPASVKIVMLDRNGREVARLVDEYQSTGFHQASWHGQSTTGQSVVSGLYLARVELDSQIEYKKVIVVR